MKKEPVLKKSNTNRDSREFLKYLDELLRLNKGSFGAMAFDVGSNKPYRVGDKKVTTAEDVPSLQWSPTFVPQETETPAFDWQSLGEQPIVPYQEIQLSDNPTPNEMIDAIFQATWEPKLPTTDQLDYLYQQTGQVYPVASMADGSVKYNDGSIRTLDQSQPPIPIASMRDGTVLWSDGFTRQMPPGGLSQYLAGVSGLSQFIFGQEQTVTQPFGNYNPGMGYASNTHQGVDYRTRDLAQREMYAPVPMRIVQVITADSGSPYGNSVLLELPTGEMIRLSHLSTLGQFKDGDILEVGSLIGTPGSTGNSTAEHLDVEYYNKDGQIDNPNNFKQNVSEYNIGNQITGISPYNQTKPAESITTTSTTPGIVSQPVQQAAQQVGNKVASVINQANPTGSFDLGATEYLQGNPEAAKQVQSETIANLGEKLNLPEMQISEAAKTGGLTGAARQLAGNVVDTLSTPFKKIGLPDFGISEKIAQGPTVNTGANFIPANAMAGENYSKTPTREDYANVLNQNLQNVGQEVGSKAGEGIQTLKNAAGGVKDLISQGLDKLTPRRSIGEQSSSVAEQVGETTQKVSTQPKNDIRDPFFKLGGAQYYSKYLAPNAEQLGGGALSLDLFSPDFFSDPNNVANVFGSTSMGKEATSRYKASETEKYPLMNFSPIGYGEGSWSGDYRSAVDKYNQQGQNQANTYNQSVLDYLQSIPSVLTSTFSFKETPKQTSPRLSFGSITKSDSVPNMSYAVSPPTPQMSFARTPESTLTPAMSMATPQMSFARTNAPAMSVAPKPVPAPVPTPPQRQLSLSDYLGMGKTEAQWYAETGRQSELDAKNREPWNDAGKQMSISPQQAITNSINAAAQGKTYVTPSGNSLPNYTPRNANMSDASTGLPVVGKLHGSAPYAVASLANGKTLYSDGSIR